MFCRLFYLPWPCSPGYSAEVEQGPDSRHLALAVDSSTKSAGRRELATVENSSTTRDYTDTNRIGNSNMDGGSRRSCTRTREEPSGYQLAGLLEF